MRKIWPFALTIFAAVIVGVIFPIASRPAPDAPRSTGVPPVMEPIQRQAGRLPYNFSTSAKSVSAPSNPAIGDASRLSTLLSAPIALQDGGSERAFELATDQLYLRGSDGASRILAVQKANTPEEFVAAIEKARAEHGTEPEIVLYPVGAPRNEFSRRIVTREVVIKAPSKSDADHLAKAGELVFQKKLDFAPDTFVYKAATSLQALSFQIDSESINLSSVSTQLAKQASTMSLPNDPYVQLQWHLKYQGQMGAVAGSDINVESVWNYPSTKAFSYASNDNTGSYIRGKDVVIGIVDDGLEWSHPDLAPNVLANLQYDWNGKDRDPKPDYNWLYDANGNLLKTDNRHGTACAGVVAARGNNRIGVSGVAPESNLVGMRLIAAPASDLDVAQAFTWLPDQIHIKSNSWGYPSFSENRSTGLFVGWNSMMKTGELAESALKYAADFGRGGRGSIFTFAAGNQDEYTYLLGNSTVTQKSGARVDFHALPNSIYTITVGAVGSDCKKSNYSQIGSSLLISAPSLTKNGLGIMTTDNKGRYGYNYGVDMPFWFIRPDDFKSSGDVTKNFSGTSAATPVVSGVIALMLQRNPNLGWRDVQEILIRSAKKVDENDSDWITANRTDHVTGNATFHFNHKYGAGLVDAAAAVALSGNWTNLGPQKSQTVTTNSTTPISANGSVTRTFTVNGTNLRVEHVTLQLSVTDIKKGNLTITLTSPGNTTSTFCLPHGDSSNEFTDWKFMTVRNWAESSNGTWTLSVSNNGPATGNLTKAELVVYGTESGAATNPAPVVTLAASRTKVFVGSNFTLNATAIDKNADGTAGTIKTLEAFVGGTSLGVSENGTWTVQANQAGNFSFTVNATDSGNLTTTSQAAMVEVSERPIAAWDFDTAAQSPVPLATAIQSSRKYAANFGSGNMTFDGSFDGDVADSNKWEYGEGQIFSTNSTQFNAAGEMESGAINKALMLRGGKNIGAQGKSIVFDFTMKNRGPLNVSYALSKNSRGFATHTWSYSTDGTAWTPIQTISLVGSTVVLNPISALAEQAKAYLRVQFTGATAASGQNIIDNIILSASPITAPVGSESFTVISKAAAQDSPSSSLSGADHSSDSADSLANQTASDQNLDWFAPGGGAYSMFLYAEVVEGAKFLNAPGSLLSVSHKNAIIGLAEAVPQTTRYELAISSAEAEVEPLRVRLYDANRQAVLVMAETLEFQGGTILGTPAAPKRFRVDYEEVEQVIPLTQGWNSFTVALVPLPAAWNSISAGYEATEGDRLVGPTSEAIYQGGIWEPTGFSLHSGASYSLWRQSAEHASITLRGKVLESKQSPSTPPVQAPVCQPGVAASGSVSTGASAALSSDTSEKKASKKFKNSQKKRGSKPKRKSDF